MEEKTFTKQEVLDLLTGLSNWAAVQMQCANACEADAVAKAVSIGSTAYWACKTMIDTQKDYIKNL